MRLIVYTSAIGDTDAVRAPTVIDPTVEYLCFSDRICPVPYEWIRVPTAEDGTPPARRLKVLASHPRLVDAATLWHDASFRLTSDLTWAREALIASDLAAMWHPRGRQDIEAEAVAIARYGYVTIERAQALVAAYRLAGFKGTGVTSGSLIARRAGPAVRAFNRTWWREVEQWHYRDQGSLDYAAWVADLRVLHVPGTVKENPYASWREAAVPA